MHCQTRCLGAADGGPITTSRAPEPAGSGALSAALAGDTVAALWGSCWGQLRACFPDIEIRLAQLERRRPTRHRFLARLEASAARRGARCLRGAAKPAELLRKLVTWQMAVVAELEREST
jgi:hypothetical protein